MQQAKSASESRPLILRPESVKDARDQAGDELPAEARPFHDVARNAHPGGGDVHADD